jgi:hypothetical protein
MTCSVGVYARGAPRAKAMVHDGCPLWGDIPRLTSGQAGQKLLLSGAGGDKTRTNLVFRSLIYGHKGLHYNDFKSTRFSF